MHSGINILTYDGSRRQVMITKGSETRMTRMWARAGISSSHYQSKECIGRTVRVRTE
jgi:hypothetical protein